MKIRSVPQSMLPNESSRFQRFCRMACALSLMAMTLEIASTAGIEALEWETSDLQELAKTGAMNQEVRLPIKLSDLKTTAELRVIEQYLSSTLFLWVAPYVPAPVRVQITGTNITIYMPSIELITEASQAEIARMLSDVFQPAPSWNVKYLKTIYCGTGSKHRAPPGEVLPRISCLLSPLNLGTINKNYIQDGRLKVRVIWADILDSANKAAWIDFDSKTYIEPPPADKFFVATHWREVKPTSDALQGFVLHDRVEISIDNQTGSSNDLVLSANLAVEHVVKMRRRSSSEFRLLRGDQGGLYLRGSFGPKVPAVVEASQDVPPGQELLSAILSRLTRKD
jgi:hypothetical protein